MLLERLSKTTEKSGSEASIRARLEPESSENKSLGLPVRANEYEEKQSKGRKMERSEFCRACGLCVCAYARACFRGAMKEFQKQKDFWFCSCKCKNFGEKSCSAIFGSFGIGRYLYIRHIDNTISLIVMKKEHSTLTATRTLTATLGDIYSPAHSHSHTHSHKRTDTRTATHVYSDTYTHTLTTTRTLTHSLPQSDT